MFTSYYSTFIGIIIISTILFILVFCIRLKYVHRRIGQHPMQVVVVNQPYHNQLQYPQTQTCWTIPVEQPPPPYNTVMTSMNTNYNTLRTNSQYES